MHRASRRDADKCLARCRQNAGPDIQRAGKRDGPDIDLRARRQCFERGQRTLDFARLIFEPAVDDLLLRAISPLVHAQDRGIENAVGKRLQRQRMEALIRIERNDAAAAGEVIEIFKNDAAVVERLATF